MPYPHKGESKKDYIARCIPYVMNEGTPKDQAIGKCYGMWKTYGAAKKAIKHGKPIKVK